MEVFSNSSNHYEVTTSLKVFAAALTVPLCLIGSFGNLAVITAIVKKRTLRNVSNILTVSLMGLSLLVCCHSYPIQVTLDMFFFNRQPWCFLLGSQLLMVSIHFSILLLLTTVERYITICLPLKTDLILTRRNVILTLLSLCLYGIFVGVCGNGLTWIGNGDLWRMEAMRCNIRFMVASRSYILFILAHWLLPIPVMTAMYLHIFVVVRRHIRQIAALSPLDANPPVATSSQSSQRHGSVHVQSAVKRRTRKRLMREAKSAFVLFLVVAVYVINWVPFTLFLLTGVLSADRVSPEHYILLHAFVYSNGTVTPYLYGLGNRKIRLTLMSLFFKRKCAGSIDDDDTPQTIESREQVVKVN